MKSKVSGPRSLRTQLMAAFLALVALFIVSIWGLNNWFLEDYYIKYKVSILENGYRQLDAAVKAASEAGSSIAEDETVTRTLQKLRDTSNITVLVYDSLRGKTILSSTLDSKNLLDRVQRYILGQNPPNYRKLVTRDNYRIQKTTDPLTSSAYLESWGYFTDNGTVFIMSMPVESIREAADIANRFLGYVGLAAMLLACWAVFMLTRRFTDPIDRLSRLAERMSNLDFGARYCPGRGSTEELDLLGNSMNALSEKLDETVGQLQSANAQLQKDIEEKEKIDEMRKEFVADVSHELKTPIALIQGYAEGLQEGMAEDPANREYYCNVIADEAGKMNRMVRQLLTLSALEFGRDTAEYRDFDLHELISGVIAASQLVLKDKGLTVQYDGTKPLTVFGDEFQIEEVVTNYLNNAMNHVSGEKKISIRTEVLPDRGVVRTTVFNSGSPIPEKDLDLLWQKFYKVDKARTRAYGGSGIGLSIVKAIMDGHHQACGVKNVGDGVEFWFELQNVNKM